MVQGLGCGQERPTASHQLRPGEVFIQGESSSDQAVGKTVHQLCLMKHVNKNELHPNQLNDLTLEITQEFCETPVRLSDSLF